MRVKKYLALSLSIAVALSFGACGTKEKTTSNQPTSKQTETVDTTKEALKNATMEGNLSDEEKAKVVELTEKYAKLGLDVDYTKDTMDTMKKFFKYTTAEVTKDFPDDTLNKILNDQKTTKQIIRTEGITYKKISKGTDGSITVDFSAKEHVISHTDANLNSKTFDAVVCRFIFNKDWKVSAFAFGDLK